MRVRRAFIWVTRWLSILGLLGMDVTLCDQEPVTHVLAEGTTSCSQKSIRVFCDRMSPITTSVAGTPSLPHASYTKTFLVTRAHH